MLELLSVQWQWVGANSLPPRTVEKKTDNELVLTMERNVKLLSY